MLSTAVGAARNVAGFPSSQNNHEATPKYDVKSPLYREYIGIPLTTHQANEKSFPEEIQGHVNDRDASRQEIVQYDQKIADDNVELSKARRAVTAWERRIQFHEKEKVRLATSMAEEDVKINTKTVQLAISRDVVDGKNKRFKTMTVEEFHRDQEIETDEQWEKKSDPKLQSMAREWVYGGWAENPNCKYKQWCCSRINNTQVAENTDDFRERLKKVAAHKQALKSKKETKEAETKEPHAKPAAVEQSAIESSAIDGQYTEAATGAPFPFVPPATAVANPMAGMFPTGMLPTGMLPTSMLPASMLPAPMASMFTNPAFSQMFAAQLAAQCMQQMQLQQMSGVKRTGTQGNQEQPPAKKARTDVDDSEKTNDSTPKPDDEEAN